MKKLFDHKDKSAFDALAATYLYLDNHPDLAQDTERFNGIFSILADLIPWLGQNSFSGHDFPMYEASLDIENARHLCFQGFYKPAFIALRNALELGLLSVYWNYDDEAHSRIKSWIAGNVKTPHKNAIIKVVLTVPNIQKYVDKHDLKSEIEDLYSNLDKYAHTRGRKYSSLDHSRANFNQFIDTSFIKWFKLFKRVVKVVSIVHILKYPVALQETPREEKFGINGPIGLFIEPGQSDQLKNIFDENTLSLLQKISSEDENTKYLLEWFNSHPDLTEEQFMQQLYEFDQFLIETNGWNSWSVNEFEMIRRAKEKDPEFYERQMKKMEALEKWAKENDFIEAQYVREAKNRPTA